MWAKARPTGRWHHLYNRSAWQSIRKTQLALHPLCVLCSEAGRVEAASICDHVVPHNGDEAAFFAGPFQSLCKRCHDSTKKRIEHGYKAVGLDGWKIE